MTALFAHFVYHCHPYIFPISMKYFYYLYLQWIMMWDKALTVYTYPQFPSHHQAALPPSSPAPLPPTSSPQYMAQVCCARRQGTHWPPGKNWPEHWARKLKDCTALNAWDIKSVLWLSATRQHWLHPQWLCIWTVMTAMGISTFVSLCKYTNSQVVRMLLLHNHY